MPSATTSRVSFPTAARAQIGIGSIGDAVGQSLVLRHRDNMAFRQTLERLGGIGPERGSFDEGLYGASEMLVECFLDLIEAGVVKREVDGVLVHGGFFLGSRGFYRKLREMTPAQRAKIAMVPVAFVNDLLGEEERKRAARKGARFVNTAMMATLTGAVVSDGLEDGRVVSGVGGQYNFVAQAFALEDARSVITLRATRNKDGQTMSNIVWSYGHTTIPRHLRDIVVTEYGVADLRGKTDGEVAAAMLSIADSRFQEELLAKAKKAGKIARSYEIPERHRHNTPAHIRKGLADAQEKGLLPLFPFGSDFSDVERGVDRGAWQASQRRAPRSHGICLAQRSGNRRRKSRPRPDGAGGPLRLEGADLSPPDPRRNGCRGLANLRILRRPALDCRPFHSPSTDWREGGGPGRIPLFSIISLWAPIGQCPRVAAIPHCEKTQPKMRKIGATPLDSAPYAHI